MTETEDVVKYNTGYLMEDPPSRNRCKRSEGIRNKFTARHDGSSVKKRDWGGLADASDVMVDDEDSEAHCQTISSR